MSQATLLYAALTGYTIAGAATLFERRLGARVFRVPAILLSGLAAAAHITFILVRARATGFLPFASRFESMGLYALAIQLAGLAVYLATRQPLPKFGSDFVSAVVLVGALTGIGFHHGGGLNPVLNSPFFAFHIVVAFAGYGVFTAGLAWTIAAFVDRRVAAAPEVPRGLALAGIVLLGAGIASGALWAGVSWGTYWSWDPKECWALLTWSVFALYVHIAGPRPRRWVSLMFFGLGTATMLFAFLGINLLRWGLHRYQ